MERAGLLSRLTSEYAAPFVYQSGPCWRDRSDDAVVNSNEFCMLLLLRCFFLRFDKFVTPLQKPVDDGLNPCIRRNWMPLEWEPFA